jgi:hypothetical protein
MNGSIELDCGIQCLYLVVLQVNERRLNVSCEKKEEKDEAAPFHVLMMAWKRPIEEYIALVKDNDLIRQDYLAKRFQIVHSGEKESNMWSAVLPMERAMIECCQLHNGEIRASLQRGKELPFCRLLAMHALSYRSYKRTCSCYTGKDNGTRCT